jgi:hypothetical protein
MAKRKKEDLLGQMVVDFANAEHFEVGCFAYYESMVEIFGSIFAFPRLKQEKFWIWHEEDYGGVTPDRQLRLYEEDFRKTQEEVKEDLDAIISGEPLLHIFSYDGENHESNMLLIEMGCAFIEDDQVIEVPPIVSDEYVIDGQLNFDRQTARKDFCYCLLQFLIADKCNRKRIRKCEGCKKFFIASKLDSRIKKCSGCSRKSTLSKEEQRLYHQKRRAKIREEKKRQETEERIKRIMKAGYTREEAVEIIKADSEV